MWQWITSNSSVIQAIATAGIVILTLLTLIVLLGYARDTKRIAQASVDQLDNAQMPFLAVRQEENVAGQVAGWVLDNQGSGPAINISYKYNHNGREVVREMHCLGPRTPRSIQNDFANATGSPQGFSIRYESLAKKPYETFISWEAGQMKTDFRKLPSANSVV
jgi:hypothetical protein